MKYFQLKIHHALPVALLTLGLNAATIGSAQANDTCNNFTIKMTNRQSNEIKLTKLEYYDYDDHKWRTENVFGVDGEQKVEPNVFFSTKRDLQHIGGDKTNFRLSYKKHLGGSQWDDPKAITTADFTCSDNGSREIIVS